MNYFPLQSADLFISAYLVSFASLTPLTSQVINEPVIHFKPTRPRKKVNPAISWLAYSFNFQSKTQGNPVDPLIQDLPKSMLHRSKLHSTILFILVSLTVVSIKQPLHLFSQSLPLR